jgi:cytosine deaminase
VRDELTALALDGRSVDLVLDGPRIAAIRPSAEIPRRLILPLLVDAHLHLDKTLVAHRIPTRPSSLFEAIELAAADKAGWTDTDLRDRMTAALTEAEAHGIGALRTHVDWDTPARPRAWDIAGELAEDWRGRIRIDRAALVPLDLLSETPGIAAEVAATGGTLGAFVYRNEHLPPKLEAVFEHAIAHDLLLDFHVDEGLDGDAVGFDTIVALTRRHGLAGQVLTGHACALGVRPEAEVARVLEAAAEAGLAHTILPTTNGFLQDARPGRTPRLRGLAPVLEARAAGVPVCIALDNVQDAFYPYGAYDLIDAWRLAVLNAHLDPGSWLDAITATPARALGLTPSRVEVGAPADFIVIEAASPAELVSRPRAARTIYREGHPLAAREPALA